MNSDVYLGIDTSNYTTSCAAYFNKTDSFINNKKLLFVEDGKRGLRQSDAVFAHTKSLPNMLTSMLSDINLNNVRAVSYSAYPRDCDGSYMPCFCVGEGHATVLASALGVKLNKFSHQAGHIAAALWSSGQVDLFTKEFIAFHVSGGTTDVLLVKPDKNKVIDIETVATSLDLKAGQAIDRIGVKLGLHFPCGQRLDDLSKESQKDFKIKPYIKDGCASFSGLENQAENMIKDGAAHCDIAKYAVSYIYKAIYEMTISALDKCGNLPVIYAGGVMSNSYIRENIKSTFDAHFAKPEFSCDNAAGVALLGKIKESF